MRSYSVKESWRQEIRLRIEVEILNKTIIGG